MNLTLPTFKNLRRHVDEFYWQAWQYEWNELTILQRHGFSYVKLPKFTVPKTLWCNLWALKTFLL